MPNARVHSVSVFATQEEAEDAVVARLAADQRVAGCLGEGDEIVRRTGVGGENLERVAHRDPIDCPLRLHDRQGAAQVSGIQKFVGHGSVAGLERQSVCGSAALAATVVQIRQLSQSVQPVRC